MSLSVTLQERVTIGGETFTYSREKSGSGRKSISESIPQSQTDLQLAFTLDVSATKFFKIVSTVNMTIETNNASSPGNTLTLVANEPYIWCEGMLDTFKLTTDVTTLYVTTGAVGTGTLVIEALEDITP